MSIQVCGNFFALIFTQTFWIFLGMKFNRIRLGGGAGKLANKLQNYCSFGFASCMPRTVYVTGEFNYEQRSSAHGEYRVLTGKRYKVSSVPRVG